MSCLLYLLKTFLRANCNYRWDCLCIFGFEENHSTEQICLGLSLLLQKGNEWSRKWPVYVIGADVKSVFDELSPETVFEAMVHWDFPADLISALLEETLDITATAELDGCPSTAPFPFTRSVRQGGIESTFNWHTVIQYMLDTCIDRWQQREYGVDLPVLGRVTHLVWADNLYFLGHSAEDVTAMAQDFTDVLVASRMLWKRSSLQILGTGPMPSSVMLWQHGHPIEIEQVGMKWKCCARSCANLINLCLQSGTVWQRQLPPSTAWSR